MKHKKSAFKESLLSVPYDRCHMQIDGAPGQTLMSLCLILTSHDVKHYF